MSYSKVQFIAYRIYTCPAHSPDRYVGLNSEVDDLRLRCKLMAEAINNAAASPDVDPSPDVLKIFVAPEFYFHSMWGAYTSLSYFTGEGADRDPNSIVGCLADVVQDDKWRDWLFVFGTSIVEAAPFTVGDYYDQRSNILATLWYSLRRFAELYGRRAVLNASLVQMGGYANEAERIAKAVVVVKEYKSGIDYLKRSDTVVGLTDERAAHFPAVGPGNYELEMNTPRPGGGGSNGGSIFMLNNITFGLEVCLDHAKARLRRASPQSGDFFVQVQLIPSGGITIQPACVATLAGGLVCNVDGYYDGTTTKPPPYQYGFHSQSYRVKATTVGQPSVLSDMDEWQRVTPGSIPANADLNEVKRVFWLPPDNDLGNPDIWKPDLVIYQIADIPDPVAASYL
jgi:hypothetical protein